MALGLIVVGAGSLSQKRWRFVPTVANRGNETLNGKEPCEPTNQGKSVEPFF